MFGANVPELAKMWLGQADDIGYEYIFFLAWMCTRTSRLQVCIILSMGIHTSG